MINFFFFLIFTYKLFPYFFNFFLIFFFLIFSPLFDAIKVVWNTRLHDCWKVVAVSIGGTFSQLERKINSVIPLLSNSVLFLFYFEIINNFIIFFTQRRTFKENIKANKNTKGNVKTCLKCNNLCFFWETVFFLYL